MAKNKEIIVPQLGESVSEATIATWHKNPGDNVLTDELVVELETDKVTLEVNAPATGKLVEIKVPEGEVVEVGTLIGLIEEGVVSAAKPSNDQGSEAKAEKPSGSANNNTNAEQVLSPAPRKIAADNNVDTTKIQGTGKGGRVTKGDVLESLNK